MCSVKYLNKNTYYKVNASEVPAITPDIFNSRKHQ